MCVCSQEVPEVCNIEEVEEGHRAPPVDADIGQQFIFGEARFNVAMAIAPGLELLHNPSCQA